MSFRRGVLPLAVVLGVVLWTAAGATAVPLTATGWNPEDGPMPMAEPHPGGEGHLPAGSRNMVKVGGIDLTNVDGGIADVAAFGNYAYLNAFSPECTGRPGAQGTGVHVVDISNPASPTKVAFIPAHTNSYPGEGIHVVRANTPSFQGDMLIHNNETCDSAQFTPSGASLWDVTDPTDPQPLKLNFGDTLPVPVGVSQTYHTTHSAQLFVQRGVLAGRDRVLAILQDNQDLEDVDIFDVSNPAAPVLLAEVGFEDWPGTHPPGATLANGDTVFDHDFQGKRIAGQDYLLVSYWDAGQVLLNITNPSNPTFVKDSDYRTPDPLMPEFDIPEGNSHQSYWDANNEFIISTDEDFSPTRTNCEIVTGPHAGATACGEFGFTPSLESMFPEGFSGTTAWGGSGCPSADVDSNGTDDRAEVLANATQAQTGADAIVFTRGVCFFSDKIHTGELAGYDMVFVGQSHGGARAGLLPDAFFCGGQGSPIDGTAAAACIGHRAMHNLFNDAPAYAGGDVLDMPAIGTVGAELFAQGGVFDGWGYVHLHDARDANLRILDSWAVPEALDEGFMETFGILSVHEVKTDPRTLVNLAYISYYNAGARVVKFNRKQGLREVGFFIPEGGAHYWGTFPHRLGGSRGAPLLLFSDRDSGLHILRYTG